jgi:hypothetical protein
MTLAEVESALQVISTLEKPLGLWLTGGEPFLNFPLLLQAVGAASRFQIPCYVETSAGWCLQGQLVYERFSQLRDAGLQAIVISCSPFHAAVIPLKRTLLAIAIALEVFGPDRVIVSRVEWLDQLRRFSFDEAIPLDQYIQSYGRGPAGVMFWEGYRLIAGGRSGFRLGYLTQRRPVQAFEAENCLPEVLYPRQVFFDLFGNFIPSCCSGLSLGAWSQALHLREEFDPDNLSPLISILVKSGPYGLFTLARDQYEYKPQRSGYVGKCHLCVDVRHHLAMNGIFPELAPQQYYESI